MKGIACRASSASTILSRLGVLALFSSATYLTLYIVFTSKDQYHAKRHRTYDVTNVFVSRDNYTNMREKGHPVIEISIEEGMSEKRLPDCLIIGVSEAGTGPLEHFLANHPNIVTYGSELHFFDSRYAKGLEWYRKKMPPVRKKQVLIEGTSVYFYHKYVPRRIHNMNNSVRLILVVDEPVHRMFTEYFNLHEAALERNSSAAKVIEYQKSFEKLLLNQTTGDLMFSYKGLQWSHYARYMKTWMAWFPLTQFHIIDRRLIAHENPCFEIRRVEKFLGLAPHARCEDFFFSNIVNFWCLRETGCVRIKQELGRMHSNLKTKLKQHFKPVNQEFFKLVGRKFRW